LSVPAGQTVSGPTAASIPVMAQIRPARTVVYLAPHGLLAVAGHREAHAVLRDHERFSSAPAAPSRA
jgi:hypothetical protein